MASDVHRPGTIYSVIEESKNKIEKIVGSFKLEKLTTINPRKLTNVSFFIFTIVKL